MSLPPSLLRQIETEKQEKESFFDCIHRRRRWERHEPIQNMDYHQRVEYAIKYFGTDYRKDIITRIEEGNRPTFI